MRKLHNDELNRLSVAEFKSADKIPVVLVLDNVRSLYNVGSVFRTADAFLCAGICLCGITACPPHKEIHKTALGAEDSVAWRFFDNTVDALSYLRQEGYTIVIVEQIEGSKVLSEAVFEAGKSYALVFGHEVKGVDEAALAMGDWCVEIPQFGTKHSLNISVSVGVVLWEMSKQLMPRMV